MRRDTSSSSSTWRRRRRCTPAVSTVLTRGAAASGAMVSPFFDGDGAGDDGWDAGRAPALARATLITSADWAGVAAPGLARGGMARLQFGAQGADDVVQLREFVAVFGGRMQLHDLGVAGRVAGFDGGVLVGPRQFQRIAQRGHGGLDLLRLVVGAGQRVLQLPLAFLMGAFQFAAQHDHGALQVAHFGQRQRQGIWLLRQGWDERWLIQDSPAIVEESNAAIRRSIIPLADSSLRWHITTGATPDDGIRHMHE